MTLKERYRKTLEILGETIPEPKTELEYDTPFHLLLAVILSAQCTDKRVNMVTPALFSAFPDAESLAKAQPEEVYEYIKSVSYPNNKTRSLIGAAKTIVEEFGGEIPDNIDDLMRIPGVGRKTANVMLAVVWNRAAMAVDTHVFRVSERIGLTTGSRNPLTTEKALMKNIPAELIPMAHHWLILHGRYVCKARRPECLECPLTSVCRYYLKENKPGKSTRPKPPVGAGMTKAED